MKNLLCVIVVMAVLSVTAQSAYRLVNGKAYSVFDPNSWTVFNDHLKVIGYSENGIICESYTTETHDAGGQMDNQTNPHYHPNLVTRVIHGQKLILKNHPKQMNIPLGSDIHPTIKAIHTGQTSITRNDNKWQYTDNGNIWTTGYIWTTSSVGSDSSYPVSESVFVYDMGVDYFPPPRVLTPEEQKAAGKKHAEQENKTVQWLFSQATNGSASAESSLGFRYLKGQGVPKDEALGR